MSQRLFPKLTLALLFVALAVPAFSQVAPAATEGGLPLTVGVGISDYDVDFCCGSRMVGISAYVDWDLFVLPGPLKNLSIQAEGNDINYGRPARLQTEPQLRQDTGLGGVKYTYRHFRNLQPYGKFLVGIGSIDFPNYYDPYYTHDTFTVIAPGGGVEYRVWRGVWVRGDYEYQFWEHTFGPRDLTPQGFTIGGSYHFRQMNAR
jgi:opacity protein-like surface antigen